MGTGTSGAVAATYIMSKMKKAEFVHIKEENAKNHRGTINLTEEVSSMEWTQGLEPRRFMVWFVDDFISDGVTFEHVLRTIQDSSYTKTLKNRPINILAAASEYRQETVLRQIQTRSAKHKIEIGDCHLLTF